MKIARFFAVLFGILGVLLLAGSMGFFLLNRNAPVRILELPQGAVSCSEDFAQALNTGDLEAAAKRMYGQPDLGIGAPSGDPESALVLDAFCSSISFAFSGKCYVSESGLARNGSITTLDVASVLEKLPERTQTLMNQRIAAAQDLSEIYDERNNFREELVTQILQTALQQALAQDARTITREVTLKLVDQDGSWWVVPDRALLQALSGGA